MLTTAGWSVSGSQAGDHLGSTSLATNQSGAALLGSETWYYPFGEVRAGGGLPTDFGYTGQREARGIGLYDYHARWYDPYLNRFIQADTIIPEPGNPQAFNRYSYVNNRPLAYVDPSGHWPSWLEEAAGAAHQFIDDMTGGFPTKIMGDGWQYNPNEAYQRGRRTGRDASTVVAVAMAVDGTARATAATASMGPTAAGTAACALTTGGTCAIPGGIALVGEGGVALLSAGEAAWGGGVLAKISGDPISGKEVGKEGTEKAFELVDGMELSVDDTLDAAVDFLGEGYTYAGNGRFVSADGLRQVRMGDGDILGRHGGGPHMNFETLGTNPARPDRLMVVENLHIYLKGP